MSKIFHDLSGNVMEPRSYPDAALEQAECERVLARFYVNHPELLKKRDQRRAAAKRRASG